MTDGEEWCGQRDEHRGHWVKQRLRCDGVTSEEAAVMRVTINTEYEEGWLDRSDTRQVIAAIDGARDWV